MAYPTYTTPRSIAGAAAPSYLSATLASSYSAGQTITIGNTSGWYEVSSSGTATTNPLGTSGVFTLVVDYGLSTEEKILCASGAISISANAVIPVWTDGTYNGRGWDGTTSVAHATGSGTNPNVFLVRTAVDDLQFNTSATTLTNNLATLSGAVNTLEASVVNVLFYGADPTGVSDSTTAIQSAINAATNGGVIFLPAGTYIVSSTINLLHDGTIIQGAGAGVNGGTIIKTASSFTSGDVFYLNNKTNRVFRDLTITYTTAPTSGYAINQSSGGADILDNVRINYYNGVNMNGHVMDIDRCNITAINNCVVQTGGILRVSDIVAGHPNGSTGAGFVIDQGANTTRIIKSQTQSGGYGVVMQNSVAPGTGNPTFVWIYDLEVNNPAYDGIYMQYGSQVYLTNVWISGAGVSSGTNNGIYIDSTFTGDVNIANSEIQDMPGHGILIEGGNGYQISNTQIGGASSITSNTYDAIHIATNIPNVMLSAIQTNNTPYYGASARYGLYVDTGSSVWCDSASNFQGVSGTFYNAGKIYGGYPYTTSLSRSTSATVAAGELTYVSASVQTFTLPTNPPIGTINRFITGATTTIQAASGVNIKSIAGSSANTYATVANQAVSLAWDGIEWRITTDNRYTQIAGFPAYSIPYGGSNNLMASLNGNTTTTPQFLTSTGSGSVAQTPSWTDSTGSGNVVLSTSPTFSTSINTPAIYNPTGGLTNSLRFALSSAAANYVQWNDSGTGQKGSLVVNGGPVQVSQSLGLQPSRFIGSTVSGAPTSTSFSYLVGDFVIDQTGNVWVCTTSGSPGSWASVSSSGGGSSGITSLTGDVTATGTGAVAATLVGTTAVSGVVNTIINVNSTVTGTVANLATLSGQFVTLSGQYNTTSGIVTGHTASIASISGSLNTLSGQYVATSGSLATLSGQFVALSGQYNTTSGIVTGHTSSIALISGNLNTVSGVAYAALPGSGGTISGNLVVASGLTVSGNIASSGTFSLGQTSSLNIVPFGQIYAPISFGANYALMYNNAGGYFQSTLPSVAFSTWASLTNNATLGGNFTVASNLTVSGTSTHIGNATFSGTLTVASAIINPTLQGAYEVATVNSSTALSTSNTATLNSANSSFYYYQSNPTNNFTVAITGAPTVSGVSATYALLVNNGSTAYLPSQFTINGVGAASTAALPTQGSTTSGITTYYQGGAAWTAADASTLDSYTFTVICTSNTPTWTLLVGLTKF